MIGIFISGSDGEKKQFVFKDCKFENDSCPYLRMTLSPKDGKGKDLTLEFCGQNELDTIWYGLERRPPVNKYPPEKIL